jgi:acetyltransferase-like isoleucine patch superfamily enzyme
MLERVYGYSLDPTARIGLSLILCRKLVMRAGSRIGSLNIIKGLDLLGLGIHGRIGNLNWITGFPSGNSDFFAKDLNRNPSLIIGEHAALTNRHLIDCTDTVEIGDFSTVAGWRSQIITHGIDIRQGRQSATRVTIGRYCFVGTGAVILKGGGLPDYSVLGAGSVLTKAFTEEYTLYVGNPALPVRQLDRGAAYFTRSIGFVH